MHIYVWYTPKMTINIVIIICILGQEPHESRIENPHYARGNTNTIQREQAAELKIYNTLVQVGSRTSCDQLEVGNNMYAELHLKAEH